MNAGADRLVMRVQRQLLASGRTGEVDGPLPSEVAALQERVRRLRSAGHRFANVRLSQHVLASAGAEECAGVGGGWVATGG